MDSDEVESNEGACAYESLKENSEKSHVATKECQEQSERWNRNSTKKGLEFYTYIEIRTK